MWENYRLLWWNDCLTSSFLPLTVHSSHGNVLKNIRPKKNYSLENTSRNVISWMLDRWDILGIMSLERSLPLDMLFLLHSIVTIFMHLAHTHTNTSIPFLSVIIKSHSTVPMSTPVEDGQWCSLLSVCTLLCTYRTIGNHRSSGITAMKKTRDRHRDSLLTWFLTIFSVDILSIFA